MRTMDDQTQLNKVFGNLKAKGHGLVSHSLRTFNFLRPLGHL